MNFDTLIRQLYDLDPRKRAESLRVLGMVEETRAFNTIVLIFHHDPDPRVREIAKWAGKLIQEARQRGHDTQAALYAHQSQLKQTQLPNLLMRGLAFEAADGQKNTMDIVQQMQSSWEQLDMIEQARQATTTQTMALLPQSAEIDDLDLLSAGLSDWLQEENLS